MKYLAITAILCLILAGASFSGEVTMTDVITGGNLTLTMPDNFSLPSKTLGGADVFFARSDVYYDIEDSRGTGAGWNVGFQIGQFVTSGTPQRTIPLDRFDMYNCEADFFAKIYGQNIDGTNGPKGLMESNDMYAAEVKGITVAAGYGMGKYRCWLHHDLDVYAETYAGTYTATLTVTLNAIP